MKFNKLALLCAVACTAFAGQASAQLANNTTAANIVSNAQANGRVLFISGASAVQGGLSAIASSLFSSSFYFSTSAGSGVSDYRAYAGPLAAAAGGWPAGTNVIIINRAKGGSVWGVNAVAQGDAIESLNITSASCTAGTGASATPFLCGLTTMVPDAGISDVAPALFHEAYNTEGEPAQPALTPVELARLTATPLYGLAFGVPMTRNLPLFNVNKSVLSAIMTGNIGTWDQVQASLGSDDVIICRRGNGSGTQAVANLYYGNYPCDTGSRSNPPADRYISEAWNEGARTYTVEGGTGAPVVIENGSSGDVRSCLNNAQAASLLPNDGSYTTYTTSDRAGVSGVTVRFRNGVAHKAVGILSMDSLNSSTTTSAWSFRSLDGAGEITWTGAIATAPVTTGTGRFPTRASLIDGTWDQQGWISFNRPNTLTGNKAALVNNFVAAARSPAVLNGVTALRYAAAAIPGTPDGTGTGQVLRAGYVGNNQCAPLNRNF